MNTAYIIKGELIDNKTIKLDESVNFENKRITVFLQQDKKNIVSAEVDVLSKIASLRGKINWDGNLDFLRRNRI